MYTPTSLIFSTALSRCRGSEVPLVTNGNAEVQRGCATFCKAQSKEVQEPRVWFYHSLGTQALVLCISSSSHYHNSHTAALTKASSHLPALNNSRLLKDKHSKPVYNLMLCSFRIPMLGTEKGESHWRSNLGLQGPGSCSSHQTMAFKHLCCVKTSVNPKRRLYSLLDTWFGNRNRHTVSQFRS